MTLSALAGKRLGPVRYAAAPERVGAFVEATSDDPHRWSEAVPPGFGAAVLFALAPTLLAEESLAAFPTLIHAQQRFSWCRALVPGELLEVSGEVSGIRSRGPLHFVGFALQADGDGPWLKSKSSFLLSAGPASAVPAEEEEEPGPFERAPVEVPAPAHLPGSGESLPLLAKSASRADLMRYAAATGDWNPVHWDHATARRAGLAGVVAHGLLVASWVAQEAARFTTAAAPLRELDVRFHLPLRPGVAAEVGGSVGEIEESSATLSLVVSAAGSKLAAATAVIRRE